MSVRAYPELKLRFLWLSIGYALVILVVYLSLTSNPVDTGMNFPYEDKFYHALAYFTLMFWFSQIYHGRFQRYMIAVVFISMGFMLEYLQSFDPKRFAEVGDMVANTTGVVLGFSIALSGAKNILLKIEKIWF
jgi:VanZ family protein